MPAIIFLVSSFLCGYAVAGSVPIEKKNNVWCRTAMAFGIGWLIAGWTAYITSYFAKVCLGFDHPKVFGNIAAIGLSFFIAFVISVCKKQKEKLDPVSWKEAVFFVVLFVFILWTMDYVFHVKDDVLSSGVTIFSDFSPHTAMIRSFSYHDNFPTQYPHFGGADVKYHFMFQFLAGNLEYLGMRIDFAFNWLSAASLWGFLVLLYYFAKQLTGYAAAGVFTVIMFFCRSSFAGIEKLGKTLMSGDWGGFFNNTAFIGYTNHEDWGLWNYNVFLNQRHLGFGLLIAAIVIMCFAGHLDWIDKVLVSENVKFTERFKTGWKQFLTKAFAGKDAWLPKSWKTAALLGLMLGALAFWNGAVVVATLLILFGFAVFSDHKLDYAITAGITLALSFIQTNFFMDKNIGRNISTNYYFGFLANEPTMHGVFLYILQLSGIFFIGILLFLLFFNGKFKAMIFAFLLPVIFAFTVSMTPDIAVNHKYIIIAVIFLNIFWSYALVRLWKATHGAEGLVLKCIAAMVFFILIITGAYDMVTIYNADKNAVEINMDSTLTAWLRDNTNEHDLILTGEDTMSETTLAGVMLYNGWPYYAWSAGYDTDTRAAIAIEIFSSTDKNRVKELIKKEGIDYIVYRDGMTYEENECSDEVIKKLYKCVFEEEGAKIYKTK